MYLISVGTGRHKPSLESVGADQFDDNHAEERKKMSFLNWWNFGLCCDLLIGMIISVSFYDRILVPFMRKATGNEWGITILQMMGIGMVLTVLMMVVTALVKKKRLRVAEVEQMSTISMSVFGLGPQFAMLGMNDGFTLFGLQEYFYDQVPDDMKSLGIALYLSVMGMASFLSSLLISVIDKLTENGGSEGWFAKDLNKSRLDYFDWFLAAIITVNLFVYVYAARRGTLTRMCWCI